MPEEGRTIRGGGHWVTKCVSKHGENGPAWTVPWFTDWFPWNSRNIFADYRCAWRRFKENKRRRREDRMVVVKAKVEK